MNRTRLLDLFCGAGGAAMGYYRAGFDVVGVVAVLTDRAFLDGFAVVHASPPCQLYSATATRWKGREHSDLIDPVRDALAAWGGLYVIENVVGAPLRDPVTLCGSMFGLGFGDRILKRHRLFESNVPLTAPADACAGRAVIGVYGTGGKWTRTAPGGGGVKASGADAAVALGIDWTDHQAALAQAIPPAYTEHIGAQLIAHLAKRDAA